MKQTIPKISIAIHQLDTAIKLSGDGDHVSAITLAGAAEELFGNIVRSIGVVCIKDLLNAVEGGRRDALKQEGNLAEPIDHNLARNTLKHLLGGCGPFECDFEKEAFRMIQRACFNLHLIMGAYPSIAGDSRFTSQTITAWTEKYDYSFEMPYADADFGLNEEEGKQLGTEPLVEWTHEFKLPSYSSEEARRILGLDSPDSR